METTEVSIHETKLFLALKGCTDRWTTSKELAVASGISARTARAHLLKLSHLNIVDVAEVFPAHRYKLAEKADKRNMAYMTRLARSVEVFGLN